MTHETVMVKWGHFMVRWSRPNGFALAFIALLSARAGAQDVVPSADPASAQPPAASATDPAPTADPASAQSPAASATAPAPAKAPKTPPPSNLGLDAVTPRVVMSVDAPLPKPASIRLDGQLVFDYMLLSAFDLDDEGTPSDRQSWGHTRAVLGLDWDALPYMKAVFGAEAFSGTAFGDLSSQGDAVGVHTFSARRNTNFGVGEFVLREGYLDFDVLVGRLKVGRQGVHWGTGMLVNNGLGDPDFGRAYRGNISDRIVFGTKPFALTAPYRWMEDLALFVAADRAVRDDNASLLRKDETIGGVFGALVDHRRTKIGFILSYRSQKDRPDGLHPTGERTTVDALTTDLYFRHFFNPVKAPKTLFVEGEVALITGHTDRPYLEETFVDGADVLSMGGLFRVGYEDRPNRLFTKLEAGFASGDNDGRDDVARSFRFNSDYRLGLILFDQVLPLMTARSADRLTDPGLLGQPPGGLRFTVNQGVVTNAWYLYPFVRYAPIADLELRLGYILAHGMADVVDLFSSGTRAGYNTTVGGQAPGERGLGQEIDASARYTLAISDDIALRLGVEGAVYLPGTAFEGVLDDPVTMVRTTMDVRW